MYTEKQEQILRFNNREQPRITILEGAVRSGKTFVNNLLWMSHVHDFENKGYNFIMTGTTIASLQRNVLSDLREYGVDTQLNKNNEFEMFGNTVCCFGSDKIDSYKPIKGFTAYGWYANEVTEHHINTIDQCLKRCSGPGARIFWDTNPGGPAHFVKTQYIDRDGERLESGKLHIKSWHFTLDDNTFLDETYKDSLKKSIPSGVWYDRDILGCWVAAEGMIYRDFNMDNHCIDIEPAELKEYWAGIDWGYEHNGVIGIYGRDFDGNCIRIKEIVSNQKTIDWWAQEALYLKRDYGNLAFYCDPARPDYISYLQQRGLWAVAADNSVVEGITCVAEQFKKNRLFIVKQNNRNYLQEIYNYRWKQNASKEEPIKEDDDSMDSERYAIYSHIGKSREIKATLSLYR